MQRHAVIPALIAAAFLGLPPLSAQDTSSKDNRPASERPVQLMTYTVTGNSEGGYYSANALTGSRMQIPLKDLPMTINVVTSELISDIGAIRLDDALIYTPGITKGADFESRFNLRGYHDATPRLNGFEGSPSSRWDSAFIDRVEVLKGPSAAMYGSTAGAGGFVNIITKKPLFQSRRQISFTANTADRYRVAFDFTGPLAVGKGQQLAYRVVGSAQDGSNNGWRDFADGERLALGASMTWRPSARTEITLEAYRDRYDRAMDSATQPYRGTDQSRLFFHELEPEFNINGPGGFDNYFMDNAIIYLTHQVNSHWTIRGVTSFFNVGHEFHRRQGFNERANSPPGTLATFALNRTFGQDRLWHRLDSLWSHDSNVGDIKFLLGVQYADNNDRSAALQDNTQVPFPLFSFTDANYAYNPFSIYRETQKVDTQDRGWLVNGMLSYRFWKERAILFANYAESIDREVRAVNYFTGQSESTVRWTKPPKDPADYAVGASYAITPQLSAYFQFGRDSRLNGANDQGVRLPNITQDILEGGVKFNVGPRFNGSLAAFEITRANLSQRDFSLPSNPILPAGVQESRGVELELYATPFANFDVILGAAFLDAKTKASVDRPDLIGQPLESAPEKSFSTWARYRFAEGRAKGLSLGLGVVSADRMHPFGGVAAVRRAFAVAPAYTLLNGMIRYARPLANGREFATQLNLNNITNEKYFAGTDYGAPFTAEIRWDFTF